MALDLNSQPIPPIDTTKLVNDEWLDRRRKGVGGSDVAAVLNHGIGKCAKPRLRLRGFPLLPDS